MDFREFNEFIKDASKYIIVIVVAILLFIYVISFQMVMGPSMEPNFNQGDLVFVSKLHYKFSDLKRGEIVVFESKGVKNLIKRVIGLPGDKIEFKDNTLYINDQPYSEDYLGKEIVTHDFKTSDLGESTVPDGAYLLLGDNRVNSQDSRELGFIKKEDIIGKVIFRFWPISKIRKF